MARKFREDIDRTRPPKRPTRNVDLTDVAAKVGISSSSAT